MSDRRYERTTLPGRRLPVGTVAAKLPFTEMSSSPIVRFRRTLGTAAPGHNPSFTCLVGQTFRRRLRPVTSHPLVNDERSFIGLCSRWSINKSTAGIGRSADTRRAVRVNGSFDRHVTAVNDPLRSLAPAPPER